MTLAATILFLAIFSLTSVDPGLLARSRPWSDSSANAPVAQEQSAQHPTQPETTKPAPAQSPATQAPASNTKASPAKKVRTKKNVDPPAACDPPPANSNAPESNSATASPQPGGAQASPATDHPKHLPTEENIDRPVGTPGHRNPVSGGVAGDQ